MTPGGGGFGEPAERDRAALVDDFIDGKISAAKIKSDYGIDIEKEVAR
jgi:N-methylhydantoinase B/oxoprolinase/acetone carboxylase alpha subunit